MNHYQPSEIVDMLLVFGECHTNYRERPAASLPRKRRRDHFGPPRPLSLEERPLDEGITFVRWHLIPLDQPDEPGAAAAIGDPRRRPVCEATTQTWPPVPRDPLPPLKELCEIRPPISPLPKTPQKPRTPGRKRAKRINPKLQQQLFGSDTDSE
ncbi:hypothetical protein ALC57_17083 [Trachymyrmex cornetzi]|uniref:Uncharacterized protein n=1 Tax=Trachymyrmex cornetzi TaxID=471704 RepID=A0A151IU73_9HYME|nr:hypothetical protein ALC57_17083 [Trachymyrmex cornetzi]